jgi:hypothetical protein
VQLCPPVYFAIASHRPKPPLQQVKKPTIKPNYAQTTEQEKHDIYNNLRKNEDFPKEIPIQQKIGKFGLMWPTKYALNHDAKELLSSYAEKGCPVDCGPAWTIEHIKLALLRGPHISAKQKMAAKQLQTETEEKIKHGYARTVKWKDIKDNVPHQLKISPIAMIPHKSRKFRAILDLSFNLYNKGTKHPSVNENTNKLAKSEAMAQLGKSITRIVSTLAKNHNIKKPFKFAKLDIKDGFWRMAVNNESAWNFCYVLPSKAKDQHIDDITIVVPNSLQMGWCESPPFFCSGTETARDIIDSLIIADIALPQHAFETIMINEAVKEKLNDQQDNKDNITLTEVFVDDFIGVTNDTSIEHLTKISRAMLHGIHSIFPPPQVSGHNGQDPVSESKLGKGEGTWAHEKEILGWILNGKNYTLQLPQEKCKTIAQLIRKILKKKRVSLNKFQKLAGKLQHASFGIPGGKGLFSPVQMAMTKNPDFINITNELKIILSDWRYMIHFLQKHPTSVLQLIVETPHYLGYSDACGIGTGGIWASGLAPLSPLLWQLEWPADIQANLVTATNKSGTLTMNDLELAGAVLNWLVLECQSDINIRHKHIGVFCDNTSAVAWAQKLRTSKSIAAGRLLRMLGMRIHARQASSLTTLNIAGEENDMADIVSRAFKNAQYFHAKGNLTHFFNSKFPLPQNKSWREFQIPKDLTSRVISCLRGELLPMESLLRLPGIAKNIGNIGRNMQPGAKLTHSYPMSQNLKETLSSQPLLQGSGQALTEEELRLKFRASQMPSQPYPRPSSWLDNLARSTERKTSINFPSNDSSKDSEDKIRPQSPS